MSRRFQILVADRNPHVRRFLTRELTAAGFEVRATDSAQRLLQALGQRPGPDLVVLDPDLPDADSAALLCGLQQRPPAVPVVIHTFLSDWSATPQHLAWAAAFVEKGANSIDNLIREVRRLCSAPTRAQPTGKEAFPGA